MTNTKLWSLLSATAVTGTIVTFKSTPQYANNFIFSSNYIFSFIIAFHLIIFFSNSQKLKNLISFHGSAMKWGFRITAMRAVYVLYIVPEHSVMGLVFVMCVWVDVVAITGIIRPSVDLWISNAVFMVVVSRSIDLFGFSARYWFVMMLCVPLLYIQTRVNGYKDEDPKEKDG